LKSINRLVREINKKRSSQQNQEKTKDYHDLLRAIEKAHKEWQDARKMFNQVHDPDLIDHAIYTVEAAEKKYAYLIKKAKNAGYQHIWDNKAFNGERI